MSDTTEPTIDTLKATIDTLKAKIILVMDLNPDVTTGGVGQELIDYFGNRIIEEVEAYTFDQVARARVEETSLWYNEWGNGKEQIGDGSWEDYYAHRIQTLKGAKNKSQEDI